MPEDTVTVTAQRRNKITLPMAAWRISIDGKDLTETIDPLLVSASLRETRDKEADELKIIIKDKNGAVEIPPRGKKIKVELGWARGAGIPVGLVYKGTYKVDETSLTGVNGTIEITARSADFTGEFRTRRNHSYVNKTLGWVLSEIAARNNYKSLCDDDLAAKTLPNMVRNNVSDAVLIAELGRKYDAVATIKNDCLIFSKAAGTKTPKGKTAPTFTIDVTDIEPTSLQYNAADRGDYNGTEAQVHDRKTGKKKIVKHGHDEKSNKKAKRLKKIYHNEDDAKADCEAHTTRDKRGKMQCEFALALGRPDIFPNFGVKLTNFKNVISNQKWVVNEITTEMGANGLKSTLSLESA